MMTAMKHEDDIRRKLRNDTIKLNKSSLEDQIKLNQRRKEEETRHLTSYSSGVKFMDNEKKKQKHSFSHFGPDNSPERMGYLSDKRDKQRSIIRETLSKQIHDNKMRKTLEKQSDDAYGQKLSHMALLMQKQEYERLKKQKEMHFQQLTR
jgi:hypothetical protein